MSLPEELTPVSLVSQEELMEHAIQNMAQCLAHFPPIARLRLLAFMHLVEYPDTTRASLEVTPSGSMRLTLDTKVAPDSAHRH
ncbi:hypothetical protein [Microvirga mediterraneensis]|uniref:Uncharacterized protein n=1 Tax=Microvirga mediterraneensis TaxID=2754695 RepID=A0A838BSR3_9HYPH|nr:hypothetical protein [Microvirga mediterraneensis]MBA1158597.1 hypothetical protein [Microvirga mediterraneensis]